MGNVDGTEDSLGTPGLACLGRAGCMAPDLGSRLHMEPDGPVGLLSVDSGHGHKTLQRSCWVHSQSRGPEA